jgi:hypothetical protein
MDQPHCLPWRAMANDFHGGHYPIAAKGSQNIKEVPGVQQQMERGFDHMP